MKISWLLRDPTWRTFHLSCQTRRNGSRSHVIPLCRSSGPFCPACAARVERELKELREAYRD